MLTPQLQLPVVGETGTGGPEGTEGKGGTDGKEGTEGKGGIVGIGGIIRGTTAATLLAAANSLAGGRGYPWPDVAGATGADAGGPGGTGGKAGAGGTAATLRSASNSLVGGSGYPWIWPGLGYPGVLGYDRRGLFGISGGRGLGGAP